MAIAMQATMAQTRTGCSQLTAQPASGDTINVHCSSSGGSSEKDADSVRRRLRVVPAEALAACWMWRAH